ncbi:MAG: glycosyltransferase family 4 protein [Actinomycetota bacterium]|jgi:glycosyltransferase involved in cell wall biosynthesis|nr:glycosyltransferase family 4 protein [Actinomycetota bacterium]
MDFVDQLSLSYEQRATLSTGWRPAAWRVLAAATGRAERRVADRGCRPALALHALVAAGRRDAEVLGAQWMPNTLIDELPAWPPAGAPVWDVLFTGTLDYLPNIEAVRSLLRMWPRIQQRRPGTTGCVAGRRPSDALRAQCRAAGVDLVADFERFEDLAARAQVVVVPLSAATGMQNKVLDAAAAGLPLVVTNSVMAGIGHDFPARCAEPGSAFVDAVVGLLDDRRGAQALAAAARLHVERKFSLAAAVERLDEVIPCTF